MKRIGVEESKKIQLSILEEFSTFCETNNLNYYLAYGTLIGCIRHKGFIPWDDDIDVEMPRDDYNRFIKEYIPSDSSIFEMIDPYNKKARHPYVKLTDKRTVKIENGIDYSNGNIGIDIDIFPLDGQPLKEKNFQRWKKKLIRIYYLHFLCILDLRTDSLKKKLIVPFLRLILKKNKILKFAQKLHEKYPYNSSEYVGVVESVYVDEGDRIEKEVYSSYEYKEFEGKKFRVPLGYHSILTNIYGNYMKIPPVEKRFTHHSNNCYWI